MINQIDKKTILITGASSGLGRELAIQYSKHGHKLILCARSESRLTEVSKICLQYTNEVYTKIIDVATKDAMDEWITSIVVQHSLDIIIANAGISAGSLGGYEDKKQVYQIFDTNLYGVLNTILPCIDAMIKQKSGQIAIISSIAGLLPMPGAPSYSTSKGAIRMLGDALRVELKPYNIKVNIIIPGFITTPLTSKNDFYMPFVISAKDAAKIIIEKLALNRSYIYFPKTLYYLTKFISVLPRPLLDYILSKLPAKKALK